MDSILLKLRSVNTLRSKQEFNIDPCTWQGLLHNCVGLSEEVGEVNGVIKKADRKKRMTSKKRSNKYRNKKVKDLGEEIADVIIYLDLVAAHFNIDLEKELVNKFNKVSNELGSSCFL